MTETLASLFAWLAGVPTGVLYGVLAGAAFLENVVPPLPADTVIAIGAFLAAEGQGSAFGVWAATMVGNVGGALLMFHVGARLGISWVTARLPGLGGEHRSAQLEERLASHGIAAVALSRLLPGVRALVPPVAGAVGVPWRRAAVAMGGASALWYGLLCRLAFAAGANRDELLRRLADQQRLLGAAAFLVLAVWLAGHWWRRRRRARG